MTHEFIAFILLWFHIWSGWLTDEYSLDDHDDQESQRILAELENIDDECDQKGVAFVKIDDDSVAREYGVDSLPSLVYFENKIPSLYHGDLANEEQVLAWLMEQLASDTIEDITDEMLDKLIKKSTHLAVLFCKSIKLSIFFNKMVETQQFGQPTTDVSQFEAVCFPTSDASHPTEKLFKGAG